MYIVFVNSAKLKIMHKKRAHACVTAHLNKNLNNLLQMTAQTSS